VLLFVCKVSIAASLYRCLNPHNYPERHDSTCVDVDLGRVCDFFCKSDLFDRVAIQVQNLFCNVFCIILFL